MVFDMSKRIKLEQFSSEIDKMNKSQLYTNELRYENLIATRSEGNKINKIKSQQYNWDNFCHQFS